MLLGDDLLYRELAYEAMSRGRNVEPDLHVPLDAWPSST